MQNKQVNKVASRCFNLHWLTANEFEHLLDPFRFSFLTSVYLSLGFLSLFFIGRKKFFVQVTLEWTIIILITGKKAFDIILHTFQVLKIYG